MESLPAVLLSKSNTGRATKQRLFPLPQENQHISTTRKGPNHFILILSWPFEAERLKGQQKRCFIGYFSHNQLRDLHSLVWHSLTPPSKIGKHYNYTLAYIIDMNAHWTDTYLVWIGVRTKECFNSFQTSLPSQRAGGRLGTRLHWKGVWLYKTSYVAGCSCCNFKSWGGWIY